MDKVLVVPNPNHLTFHRWAAELCHQDPDVPYPPVVETGWRSWAARLSQSPESDAPILPNPYLFGTWQQWAAELKKELGK